MRRCAKVGRMGRAKVRGICKLCLLEKELKLSHLLGRGVSKLLRELSGGDPVIMTPEIHLRTSRQVRMHLLCESCEEQLNEGGERYVTSLLWRVTDFPPLRMLRQTAPLKKESSHWSYSGESAGLKVDQFAHYAMGVVWRCAAHRWTTIGRQTAHVKLDDRLKDMRQYLLGGAFPTDMAVIVTVCTDLLSQTQCFGPAIYQTPEGHASYPFLVLGLHFNVIAGDAVTDYSNLCCVGSGEKWVFTGSHMEFSLKQYGELSKSAQVAQNVQELIPGLEASE